MKTKVKQRLPKILKINHIDADKLCITVLFANCEDRVIDFENIFKNEWQLTPDDPEYILLMPDEFAKVKVANHTLSWDNVDIFMTGTDGIKKKVLFEVGADSLYDLSIPDEIHDMSVGLLVKNGRLAAMRSQSEVATLSGTSRTYISRLESGKQDIEVMTLKKIVEAGLNRHLNISIV